ncbi:MAG: hypothetical protein HKN74_06060 [Acidimicrobiia bacterium]|nr:hypothetical protein [Acidimicrobiia bacterium]
MRQKPRSSTAARPDRLLVEAALDIEAPARWEAWLDAVPLDDADASEVALLPLVHSHLAAVGYEGPEMGRLRGISRQGWYRSRLLLDHAENLFRTVEAPAAASGDVAIMRWTAGARPERRLRKLDLLVRGEEVFPVLEAARRLGWSLANNDYPVLDRQRRKGLVRSDGLRLDVHWYFAGRHPHAGPGDVLWPAPTDGWDDYPSITTLPSTELLLTLLTEGASADTRLTWIPDVVDMIRCQSDSIEWKRLSTGAAALRLRPVVRERLQRVDQLVPGVVLESVLDELRHVTLGEQIERWFVLHSGANHPWRALPASWSQHRYEERAKGQRANFLPFVTDRVRRRLGGRVRRRASGSQQTGHRQ